MDFMGPGLLDFSESTVLGVRTLTGVDGASEIVVAGVVVTMDGLGAGLLFETARGITGGVLLAAGVVIGTSVLWTVIGAETVVTLTSGMTSVVNGWLCNKRNRLYLPENTTIHK